MAAPTYDSSQSTFSAANVASLTTASWTIAGSNRYLVAGVASGAGVPVNPSSCKWGGSGGTALTQFGSTLDIGSFLKGSLWGLVAPSASTTTLYASWGSNQDETVLMGVSANGVDQTTSTGTLATATGSASNAATVNVTTVADDFVVDFAWGVDINGFSPTIAVGAGQTSRREVEGGSLTYEAAGMSTEVATTTSTTMSWTYAPTSGTMEDWGMLAIGLKPVAAGGTSVTPSTLALTLALFAPAVVVNTILTPSIATLTLAGFAPSVVVNTTVTPSIATLSLTGFAPTVSVSDHILLTPDTATLTLTTFAPTVTIPGDTVCTPDTASLTLTGFAPTVEVSIDDVPVVIIGGDDAPRSRRKRRKDTHDTFREMETTIHGLLHPESGPVQKVGVEPVAAGAARRAVDELVILAQGQHDLIQRAAALRAELTELEDARARMLEQDEEDALIWMF